MSPPSPSPNDLYTPFQGGLYINGAWQSSNSTYQPLNPATELPLGQVPNASPEQIQSAINAAAKGMKAWNALDCWQRNDKLHLIAQYLLEDQEACALTMSKETGKPLAQAEREVSLSYDQFIWCGEEGKRLYGRVVDHRAPNTQTFVYLEPVGLCAAFCSWNFPLLLAARKLAPALAAGCAMIIRPSRQTPGSVMHLVRACERAELPQGLVALLCHEKANTITLPLMKDPRVRKISLTGSGRVGKALMSGAAETVKKVTMELGGHAPVIVWDDANIDKLIPLLVRSKFANAGQVCVSPTRFFVHHNIYDEFVERFATETQTLKLGEGTDRSSDMGPMVSKEGMEAVEALVARTIEQGAKLVCGGKRAAAFDKGWFFEPTILKDVPLEASGWQEEPFAPVALFRSFSDEEEMFQQVNAHELGLAAYVFSQDLRRAHESARRIECGLVGVNSFGLAAAETPFGGIKQSGFGRESGSEALREYTQTKNVTMSTGF